MIGPPSPVARVAAVWGGRRHGNDQDECHTDPGVLRCFEYCQRGRANDLALYDLPAHARRPWTAAKPAMPQGPRGRTDKRQGAGHGQPFASLSEHDAIFTRAFDEILSRQGRDGGSPSSWAGRCNAMSGPDASLGEMPGFLVLAGPAASGTGRCWRCSCPSGRFRRMRGIGCMRRREWLPAWPARRSPPWPEGTPGYWRMSRLRQECECGR